MKMYRILSLSKNFKVVKSPFVFSKKDAKFRCEQANKHFRNIHHTIRLSVNYSAKEIRYMYPEDISFSKLEALVKGLKNNDILIADFEEIEQVSLTQFEKNNLIKANPKQFV